MDKDVLLVRLSRAMSELDEETITAFLRTAERLARIRKGRKTVGKE